LVEPIQRALPGLFGRGFVVTGGRIIVEAVIGAFVDMTLVRHLRGCQSSIEGWPAVGDARVEFAVLRIYRRLDLGRIRSVRLRSVERNSRSKIRTYPHRQLIDNATAEAEPD